MQESLDIIRAEHRGMWRLSTAMDALSRDMQRTGSNRDVDTLIRMLDYLDSYSDRMHHPKEDDYLFRRLRERCPEAEEALALLEGQHQGSPMQLERLRGQAKALAAGKSVDRADFFAGVDIFSNMMREHIRSEETTILPLARKVLTEDDWREIDAAFLANDDPLFGAHARAEFDALKTQIVHLAPEGVGLGGQQVDAAPATHRATAPALQPKILEIQGLGSHYGRIQALHGVDLEVGEGQLVALVGANGAGKTTLLRTISGVQPSTGGTIRFRGEDITRLSPERRVRLGICQVPEGRQVFGPMSIEDNLRLGAFTRPNMDEDLERMYALFPILQQKRRLPAGTLSGGQQQMLAMARALMGRPKLLLLDEPSMGLAPLLVEEVFRVITRLKSEGISIFLVEQNAHAALAIADVGYVIETGRILMSGPGRELLKDEQVKRAYLGM